MNIETGQEEYIEKAQENKADHAKMAVDAVGWADQFGTEDEWSRRRRDQALAEAQVYATLAVSESIDRLLKAWEEAGHDVASG